MNSRIVTRGIAVYRKANKYIAAHESSAVPGAQGQVPSLLALSF